MLSTIKNVIVLSVVACLLLTCGSSKSQPDVTLLQGVDGSAGGLPAYIVTTNNATYFLEKNGGGLSSIVDLDGIDWLGFHNKKGSGWKGEYRGFPNAVHKQDGNYFHAMNSGTEPSTSVINIETPKHVRITFTSDNGQWQGQWDFYPDRCDFTMTKVRQGYQYWVQYEGVPGGQMDKTDFWFASIDDKPHLIDEPFLGDLPAPEWMAFGDVKSSRMLYVLHHEDDHHPDNYVSRPYMTVFGFGRSNKDKFLTSEQTFSIGFVESTEYRDVEKMINSILLQ